MAQFSAALFFVSPQLHEKSMCIKSKRRREYYTITIQGKEKSPSLFNRFVTISAAAVRVAESASLSLSIYIYIIGIRNKSEEQQTEPAEQRQASGKPPEEPPGRHRAASTASFLRRLSLSWKQLWGRRDSSCRARRSLEAASQNPRGEIRINTPHGRTAHVDLQSDATHLQLHSSSGRDLVATLQDRQEHRRRAAASSFSE